MIKPCPFCGSTEVRARKDVYNKHRQYKECETVSVLTDKVFWYVECLDCDAKTGNCWDDDVKELYYELYKDGREMAIASWNDRIYEKEEHLLCTELFNALGIPYTTHADVLREIQRLKQIEAAALRHIDDLK